MSKYTTEVRFICEALAGYDMSQGFGKVSDIISQTWNKVFDFDFPIFDEEYRQVLCKKILLHYYTREIGLETVGLWKLKLQTKLTDIMPYYNQLYKSALREFDPFRDADYYKDHKGRDTGSGNSSRQGSGSGNGWRVYSDTPQGALVNVQNETYLTDATKTTTSSSDQSSGTNNYDNTDEYLDHVYGKFPGSSYSKLLTEYRKTLLNIDAMVIDDLGELFMKIW